MKADPSDLIAGAGLASKSEPVPPHRSPYDVLRRTGPRAPRPFTEVNYVYDPKADEFRRVVGVRMLP